MVIIVGAIVADAELPVAAISVFVRVAILAEVVVVGSL